MKRRSSLMVFLFCLFALTFSFAQDVRYNFDKNTDFSKFKTYKWVSPQGAERLNDMAERQLLQIVETELAKKGLQKTDAADADLLIAYQVALSQEKQFTSYSSDFGYGPGWGRGWYGGGMSTTSSGSTSTIHIGHLDLEMYDRSAKSMVWRGTASKTIDAKAKPEKQEKNMTKAVAKLLKNYPPQAK